MPIPGRISSTPRRFELEGSIKGETVLYLGPSRCGRLDGRLDRRRSSYEHTTARYPMYLAGITH